MFKAARFDREIRQRDRFDRETEQTNENDDVENSKPRDEERTEVAKSVRDLVVASPEKKVFLNILFP
jgi:hypothetical protein